MRKSLMAAAGIMVLAVSNNLMQADAAPFFVLPPDLVISKLTVSPLPGNASQIGKITIDVADNCHRPASYVPFAEATIYTAQGGTQLYGVGNTFLVTGGAGELNLDVSSQHLPMTAYVYAQVDPANKIHEVVETNNYQSHNPNVAPFPQPAGYCNVPLPNGMTHRQ